MIVFLLWIILALISLPLAILALVVYPVVWLVLLPLRLLGLAFDVVFQTLHAVLTLPARLLRLGQRK